MFNIKKKAGVVALLALFTMGSASAVVLDTFDYGDANFQLVYSGGSTASLETVSNGQNLITTSPISTTNYAAGYHFDYGTTDINTFAADVVYQLASNGTVGTAKTTGAFGQPGVFGSTGNLEFSTDNAVLGDMSIFYGATNQTPSGPINLASYGEFFYFDLLTLDQAFDFSITVFYGGGLSETYTDTIDGANFANLPERQYIAFDDFVNADFTQVDAIEIRFQGTAAADFTIAEFGVIPEPGTLAIFGLALVGLAFGSRKKA